MTTRSASLDAHLNHAFASLRANKGQVSRSRDTLKHEIETPQKDALAKFNALILQHQDDAYNFAFYLLGDPDTAEDATQQAFINAFLHYDQFQGTNFKGWLFKILKNTCIDEFRREKRRSAYSLNAFEDEEDPPPTSFCLSGQMLTPEQALAQKETSCMIQAALRRLEAPFRSALVLVDIQGMDYQEAAQVLDVPIGTLKSRLARARRQFRGIICNNGL